MPGPQVFFSPGGDCERVTVTAIRNAQKSISAVTYIFTSLKIATALVDAKRSGVSVEVILDRYAVRLGGRVIDYLHAAGIEVRVDLNERSNHQKFCLIDGYISLSGSYNWSCQSDYSNAEQLVVLQDEPTGLEFAKNFAYHWSHSRPIPGQRKT